MHDILMSDIRVTDIRRVIINGRPLSAAKVYSVHPNTGDFIFAGEITAPRGSDMLTAARNFLANDEAEADANSRLIAAAPDLLAALKRLLAAHDADVAHGFENLSALVAGANEQAADQARRAIARAEGVKS